MTPEEYADRMAWLSIYCAILKDQEKSMRELATLADIGMMQYRERFPIVKKENEK